MSERELAILVHARAIGQRAIDGMNKSVRGLEKSTGHLTKSVGMAGAGLRTLVRAGMIGAGAGITFLAAQVKFGIDSLRELARVESLTSLCRDGFHDRHRGPRARLRGRCAAWKANAGGGLRRLRRGWARHGLRSSCG